MSKSKQTAAAFQIDAFAGRGYGLRSRKVQSGRGGISLTDFAAFVHKLWNPLGNL